MQTVAKVLKSLLWLLLLLAVPRLPAATPFRVASFNLENYLLTPSAGRPAKPLEARAKIRESIRALNPDVLALQEVGGTNALLELRQGLKTEGLDYPHWLLVPGHDTNIMVAVLSKFPLAPRKSSGRNDFLAGGRRFHLSRGFVEVDVQVTPHYQLTLINAHLKSRRPIPDADEEELRTQEAYLLRARIDAYLAASPQMNLVVLGDLNDQPDARSTRTVMGRGKKALVDTRPSEPNGDRPPPGVSRHAARSITWTHYFARNDSYSRIDYLLISRGLAREWVTNETSVLALPNWGLASDHRPIMATFEAAEK